MRSHFRPEPRVLLACAAGATAMLTGVASAAQIAADNPSDAVYADGWQEGDNGGYGFTGWSFYGTYTSAVQHALDNASPYNQLGLAWTLYLPNGNAMGSPNPPPASGSGPDLSRAGRGFVPLAIGQTISVVVDNPTERLFYKGYGIKLISGGQNNGYFDPTAITRLSVGLFEYFTYGSWLTPNGPGYFGACGVTDIQTGDAGMRLDVTLTGANSYSLTLTPLAHQELAYSESGALSGSGPIDWIMFEHYNTDSDFFDAAGPHVAVNPQATDFYISSMEITGPTGGGGDAPVVSARPAPNPGGKNAPGPKQTEANPNGFFQLLSEDDKDPNPMIYVADSASTFVAGPFANGDIVKITINASTPGQQPMGGGVQTHISLNGTPMLYATDSDGNTSTPAPIPVLP